MTRTPLHHPALLLPGIIAALLPCVAACSVGARLAEPEPVRVASLPPPFAGFSLAAQSANALAGGTLRLRMQGGVVWDVDSNTAAGATLADVLDYPCGDAATNYGVVDPNTGTGSADVWELDAGTDGTNSWFPTGGVEFDSSAYTQFQLKGNGATLVWAGNTGTAGTLGVSGNRHTFSNLTVRNTGTAGANLFIDASSNNVTGVSFVDITIPQGPGGAAAPVNFRQSASTRVNMVTLERVRLDMNTSSADGIGFGGTAPTSGYGVVYLIDCFVRGCALANNSNAVSTDALGSRGVLKVYGGEYSYSGGPNFASGGILGFSSDTAGSLELYGVKVHHGNYGFETTAAGFEVFGARVVEDCEIYGALSGVCMSDHTTNAGAAVVRRTRVTRDPGRDINNTNGFNRAGIRVDTPNALIEDTIVEGYKNANAGTLHDQAVRVGNLAALNGASVTLRNVYLKDCFNGITDALARSGLLHLDNVLITGKPKTYAAAHYAINLTQGDVSTNQLAVVMNNVVTIWEPVDASTNTLLRTGGQAINSLCGDNYFWCNTNCALGAVTTGVLPDDTVPIKDVSTTDATAKPLYDDLGRELPTSPTRNRGRSDSLLASLFRANNSTAQTVNPNLYGFGDVTVDTAPTRLAFTINRASDTDLDFKWGTVVFLNGPNAGQWRPIVDYQDEASYATVTIGVPTTDLSSNGNDVALFGSPWRPMAGTLNSVREMSMVMTPFVNPWQADALGRERQPFSGVDVVRTQLSVFHYAEALNAAKASPGWLKAVPQPTDHRRQAPWRGHDPGRVDPLEGVRK